jgi:hypothetical protein
MPSIYTPPSSGSAGQFLVSGATNTGASNTAIGFSGLSNPSNSTGTFRAPDGVITKTDEVNMEELESLPFNTPIETLLNLWIARFGNDWVDVNEVLAEEFYGLTYKRLKSVGQLETHYLTNKSRFVCRKPI